jgi:hypothetical protein
MPRTRARANRSRCGGPGGQSSLGVTAQRTLRNPDGAVAIGLIHEPFNRPLRIANARYPRLAMSAPGSCTRALSKLSWTSQSSSNDQRAQRGRSTGSHSGCPTSYAIPFSSTLRTGSESGATRLAEQPNPAQHLAAHRARWSRSPEDTQPFRDTMPAPA